MQKWSQSSAMLHNMITFRDYRLWTMRYLTWEQGMHSIYAKIKAQKFLISKYSVWSFHIFMYIWITCDRKPGFKRQPDQMACIAKPTSSAHSFH